MKISIISMTRRDCWAWPMRQQHQRLPVLHHHRSDSHLDGKHVVFEAKWLKEWVWQRFWKCGGERQKTRQIVRYCRMRRTERRRWLGNIPKGWVWWQSPRFPRGCRDVDLKDVDKIVLISEDLKTLKYIFQTLGELGDGPLKNTQKF